MNRRDFLRSTAVGVACLSGSGRLGAKGKSAGRPNILFCISDDQSWIHTSAAGDPVVKTPHFDRIAREGILFSNSFTGCPSCAPSRASVLTGQNFWRLEEGGLLFGSLNKKFPIYTQLLTDAGYVVGATGKGYTPANQKLASVWKSPCGKRWSKRLKDKAPRGVSSNDYAGAFADFMKARDTEKPFCFWYGGFEPHRSYGYGNGAKSGMDISKTTVPPFLPDSTEVRNDVCDYLFEIQWFDSHLGRMLKTLEDCGQLDNTIIVVTSDNGMPFPRAKATAYNYGVHMPLAIRWGKKIAKPGRKVDDFVNHIDFAPTFLDAAGVKAPETMTGRSLMNIFESSKSGQVDPSRTMTVTGLERHVWARPEGLPYPRRVIHTAKFVYIRNYEPDRWPMGGPDFKASHQGTFGDIDSGPTKSFMMQHKAKFADLFAKSFEKLPEEELYAIDSDPAQMKNLASDAAHQEIKKALRKKMVIYLKTTADPRADGKSPWDNYPFYSGNKYLKGKYLEEVKGKRK
jgi:N-sulfoglucosamine sulfohydrolase